MRTAIHIRRARPFDAGPIARLLNTFATRGPPLTAAELQNWITPDTLLHMAERDGAVLGLQWIEPHRDLPPTTRDMATFIAEGTGDIGIGTRLFEASRAAAKAAGLIHLHVDIDATNDGALVYYQSRGFERLTPRHDPASGRTPGRRVAMTYRL